MYHSISFPVNSPIQVLCVDYNCKRLAVSLNSRPIQTSNRPTNLRTPHKSPNQHSTNTQHTKQPIQNKQCLSTPVTLADHPHHHQDGVAVRGRHPSNSLPTVYRTGFIEVMVKASWGIWDFRDIRDREVRDREVMADCLLLSRLRERGSSEVSLSKVPGVTTRAEVVGVVG